MSFDFKLNDGDIAIENSGDITIVKDEDKLIQDILKMLFTSTGELPLHPWYGTSLLSRVVGQAQDPDILFKEVTSAIESGLNNLKQLQQLQQRDQQFLTAKELISRIKTVDAKFDDIDTRKLTITIEVITKSNSLVSESFTINV